MLQYIPRAPTFPNCLCPKLAPLTSPGNAGGTEKRDSAPWLPPSPPRPPCPCNTSVEGAESQNRGGVAQSRTWLKWLSSSSSYVRTLRPRQFGHFKLSNKLLLDTFHISCTRWGSGWDSVLNIIYLEQLDVLAHKSRDTTADKHFMSKKSTQ